MILNHEIGADGLGAELAQRVEVKHDGRGALCRVALEQSTGHGPGIQDDVVKYAPAGMFVKCSDVVSGRVSPRLARLSHEVADIYFGGARACNRFGDSLDKQVGNQRRVKRTGSQRDEIRLLNGRESFRQRLAPPGDDLQVFNGTRVLEMLRSPRMAFPSVRMAFKWTSARVAGKISPRMASTSLDKRMALAKSCVRLVSAVRKRLPRLCPRNPWPLEKR